MKGGDPEYSDGSHEKGSDTNGSGRLTRRWKKKCQRKVENDRKDKSLQYFTIKRA